MNDLIALVRDANPGRHHSNIFRRAVKLMEEAGEVSEAWLNVTSAANSKGKTWDDVREEIADVLIVALDVALTPLPHETNATGLVEAVRGRTEAALSGVFLSRDPAQFGRVFAHVGKLIGKIMSAITEAESSEDADGQWMMVRYETLSLAQAAAELAMVCLPDRVEDDFTTRRTGLDKEVLRKLAKWTTNRARRVDAITEDAV